MIHGSTFHRKFLINCNSDALLYNKEYLHEENNPTRLYTFVYNVVPQMRLAGISNFGSFKQCNINVYYVYKEHTMIFAYHYSAQSDIEMTIIHLLLLLLYF